MKFGVTALVFLSSPPMGGVEVAAQVSEFDAAFFRSRRGADVTVVDGVLQFEPSFAARGEGCRYVMSVAVSDSLGMTILEEAWERVADCPLARASDPPRSDRRIVETLQFALKPGEYTVDILLQPKGLPELARRRIVELRSLESDEDASDLILARGVGWVEPGVEPGPETPYTLIKGQLGIAADPHPLTPVSDPRLSYYLEVYPDDSVSAGPVEAVVRGRDGREVARFQVDELARGRQPRPIAGTVDLTGLPPGEYELEMDLPNGWDGLDRTRSFSVLGATPNAPAPADGVAEMDGLESYFQDLADEEVERLFDPIVVWLNSERQRDLYRSLPPEGKRNFLLRFFRETGPSLLGPEFDESALSVYLRRIDHIETKFSELAGETEVGGWRTDRGRIYLLRGEPDTRIDRPFPRDSGPPYIIWSYDIGPRYVYLFIDETRFGNYQLIFSNDPGVALKYDWQRRAGQEAIDALVTYFGIRARFPDSVR